jgi:hypothetical protein
MKNIKLTNQNHLKEVEELMDVIMKYTLICFFMTLVFSILFIVNSLRENQTSVFNAAHVRDNALSQDLSSDEEFIYIEIIDEEPPVEVEENEN